MNTNNILFFISLHPFDRTEWSEVDTEYSKMRGGFRRVFEINIYILLFVQALAIGNYIISNFLEISSTC